MKTEALHGTRIVRPAIANLDPQPNICFAAVPFLQNAPHAHANLLQSFAAFTDQNGFLSFAFGPDDALDIEPLLTVLEARHFDRRDVRNFLTVEMTNLFTHGFMSAKAHALVG